MDSKSKEFWLTPATGEYFFSHQKEIAENYTREAVDFVADEFQKYKPIHVIEYSAYEKLEAENKVLREGLEFYSVNGLAKVEHGMPISEKLCSEYYINGSYARECIERANKFRG